MIDCPNFEERKQKATIGCCGLLSVTGFVTGIVTALTIGSTCGIGYLLSGAISTVSLITIKSQRTWRKVSKDLEDSVGLLQSENESLIETNKNLETITEGLQLDINIITESVKIVGESTDEFMTKLKSAYDKLKNENDRHHQLNRQQGMFQLMQMFKHFDTNQDFRLSESEIKNNEIYLKAMFPTFSSAAITDFTYEQLVNTLLP